MVTKKKAAKKRKAKHPHVVGNLKPCQVPDLTFPVVEEEHVVVAVEKSTWQRIKEAMGW